MQSSLLESLGILCGGQSTNSEQHEALLLNARNQSDYWLVLYKIATKLIRAKGNMSALMAVLIELKNWKHAVPMDRVLDLLKRAPREVCNVLIGCVDTQFSLNGPTVLEALANRQIPLPQRCIIAAALTPSTAAAKTFLLRFMMDLLQQKPTGKAFDTLCGAIAKICVDEVTVQAVPMVISKLVGPGMSLEAKRTVSVLMQRLPSGIPKPVALLLLQECGNCQCNVDAELYAQLMARAPPNLVPPPVQWKRMLCCIDSGLDDHKKAGRLLDYASLMRHPSPYLRAAEVLYGVGLAADPQPWVAETAKVTGMQSWIVWSYSRCLFMDSETVFHHLKYLMNESDSSVEAALALVCLIKTIKSHIRLESPSAIPGARRYMDSFCESCMSVAISYLDSTHINVHRLLGLKLIQKIFRFMDGRITDILNVVAGSVTDAKLLPGTIVSRIFPMVGLRNLCIETSTILYRTVIALSPYFTPDVAASVIKNAMLVLVRATAEDTQCARLHFAFEAVAHLLRVHFKPEIAPTGVRAAIGLLSPIAAIVGTGLQQCRPTGTSFTRHGYFLQLLALITKLSFVKPPPNLGTALGRQCSYLVSHLYGLTLWTLKRMKQPSYFRMKHPDCEVPVSSADKLLDQLLNVQPRIWLRHQRESNLEDLQKKLAVVRRQYPMLPVPRVFDSQLMDCDEEEEGETVRQSDAEAPWCQSTEMRSRQLISQARMPNSEQATAVFTAVERQFCLMLPPLLRSMFMQYSPKQKTLQQRLEHIVDTVLENDMKIFKAALGDLSARPGAYKQVWLLVNGHIQDVPEALVPIFEQVRGCPIVLNYFKWLNYGEVEMASKQLDIPEGMFSGRPCAAALRPMPRPTSFSLNGQPEEDGDVAMSEGPSAPGAALRRELSAPFDGMERTARQVETFFPRAKTLIADPSEVVRPLQKLIAYYMPLEPYVALLLMCDFTHVPSLMHEQFLYEQLQQMDDRRCQTQAAVCCALRMRDQPGWKPPQPMLGFLVGVLEQPKYLTTCGWTVLLERIRLLGYRGELPTIRKHNLNVEPYIGQGDTWHLAECEYF